MSEPEWREVKLDPEVLDKLSRALRSAGYPSSDEDIYRDIIQYVRGIFQEQWQELHQTPDGFRRLPFFGDDFPLLLFFGELEHTVVYDFAIVEQVVSIFDVQVVGFDEQLEDPADPPPDR